ncbi:MAG: hypothetical protein FJW23_00685 [Acidimicrobiia bacterium]|nr:hypothetical protein [Acidimicrobiia bacterium]
MKRTLTLLVALLAGSTWLQAEDWPEFRGKGRTGVWNETGTIDTFPESGLKVAWRVPLKAGMSGPSVADGRVFISDYDETEYLKGTERALALDEQTGKILWTKEWPADYSAARISMMSWSGPTATPTVDGDRVYVLGRSGLLFALKAATGEELWRKDFRQDTSAHPIVDGNLVILQLDSEDGGYVVALDRMTGGEVWKMPPLSNGIGGSAPVIIEHAGARQLLIWHTQAVLALDPATGRKLWDVPFATYGDVNPGLPVKDGNILMISTFNLGSMVMQLDDDKPGAKMLWRSREGVSDVDTEDLHALFSPPMVKNGFVYGICSYGQLRALNVKSGERIWESQSPMAERARFSSAFLVRVGDSDKYFINNDRGELIIARLTPERYEELDRIQLVEVTTKPYNRRRLGAVSWMHPAYANGHIIARNDSEIIRASLKAD